MPIILDNSASLLQPNHESGRREHSLALAERMKRLGLDHHAKALRVCGRTRTPGLGGPLVGFPCNMRACPACQDHQTYIQFQRLKSRVEVLLAEGGNCVAITLTEASSTGTIQARARALRARFTRLFRRNAWRASDGFKNDVGLVEVLDVGKGPDPTRFGNPHLHILACGPDGSRVMEVAAWILNTWLRLNPTASRNAQKMDGPLVLPGEWQKWLRYSLNGLGLLSLIHI